MNTHRPAQQTIDAASASLLNISGLRLVLPQNEILALEAMSEIDTRDVGHLSVGWLQHMQQRWPVYCLSAELTLLAEIPASRRACVLLGAADGCVGILCDDVSIEQSLQQRHELPRVMCVSYTPILGLSELDTNVIACVTNAQRLAAYVARLTGD